MKNYPLVLMSFLLLGWNVNAQTPTVGSTDADAGSIIADPPRARSAEEMIVDTGVPDESCRQTKDRAIRECLNPTGEGFQMAGQFLTALPGIATAFMSGEDPGKMAEMCKLTQAAGMIGGLLNQGQGKTCQHASAACQSKCGEAFNYYRQEEGRAISANDVPAVNQARFKQEEVQRFDEECQTKVAEQMQLAQQQQQANQAPMAGAEACQNALNSDDDFEEELVDCSLAQYANSAQCTTLGKTDGGNSIGFEQGKTISQDNSAVDLPDPDPDREAFWDGLKNKTGGNAGRGGGAGMGGAGPMGGGPGGGGGGNNRAGGAARKSGSTMLSGGNDSSGGGGGGFNLGGDDDFNKKFAKLDAKKKKLNMLTKKKIGGRGIASSEFGLASDDIWTRVYLRTNTRCTKQLTECTANKSLNPYGVLKNKAR